MERKVEERSGTRSALLILGEFAMRHFTPGQADDLAELVSERARHSIVIPPTLGQRSR